MSNPRNWEFWFKFEQFCYLLTWILIFFLIFNMQNYDKWVAARFSIIPEHSSDIPIVIAMNSRRSFLLFFFFFWFCANLDSNLLIYLLYKIISFNNLWIEFGEILAVRWLIVFIVLACLPHEFCFPRNVECWRIELVNEIRTWKAISSWL